jgi:hypothetical protein
VAGLPLRYTMKLLAPIPIKALGPTSMGPLLGALGLKLVVMEDTEVLEKIRRRLVPSKNARHNMLATKRRAKWRFPRGPEFARLMGARGILKASPKQRSRIARHAARIRWARVRGRRISGTSPAALRPDPE